MRWKGFITLAVLSLATFLFLTFFLDDIIELSVEKAGTYVWGAKVEIDDVGIKLSPLSLKINQFRIASKDDPYKNLIDVESLNLAISAEPLLEGKINISEVSGTGMRFGTERQTSGFLSKKEKKERKQTQSKWKEQLSSWMEDVKKRGMEKIDVTSAFGKEDLLSEKAVEAASAKLKELSEKYGSLSNVEPEEEISKAAAAVNELKSIEVKDAASAVRATEKIKEASLSVKTLEGRAKEIKDKIKELNADISALQGLISNIRSAKEKDFKRMMSSLKLPSLEADDIAETVFGPLIVDYYKKITGYVEKVRKHIPPKKEEEKTVSKPRASGEDIIFEKEKMYAPFLIKKALVSGENAFLKAENFTTTPWITGKPAVFSAGYKGMTLKAEINRSGNVPSETFSLVYPGFNIAGSPGNLEAAAVFKGDGADIKINWAGKGLLPQNWLSFLNLKDPEVMVEVSVKGTLENPRYKISSNLDKLISNRLKKELDRKVAQARSQLRQELNSRIQQKEKELKEKFESLKAEKTKALNEYAAKVQQEKVKLESQIEKKRQEVVEQPLREKKKEVEKQLKDLFK